MPLFLLRFWRPLLALAVMAGCWLWFQHALSQADAKGYARARLEDKAAADAQAERMRELARAAELRYVVKREATDRYFVETVKEIHDAAAPLAACPVPDALRVRVNDAIACATGNSASPCGAAGEVPGAAAPPGLGNGQ